MLFSKGHFRNSIRNFLNLSTHLIYQSEFQSKQGKRYQNPHFFSKLENKSTGPIFIAQLRTEWKRCQVSKFLISPALTGGGESALLLRLLGTSRSIPNGAGGRASRYSVSPGCPSSGGSAGGRSAHVGGPEELLLPLKSESDAGLWARR